MMLKKRLEMIERTNDKQKTETDFAAHVDEMRKWYEDMQAFYMSPEETAKRKANYEELQKIGEQRKAAFYKGESMPPLPWEMKADI